MDILFYLVDGTVEVSEPRINNSGLPQGAYLKRLRVPKGPAGPPGSPPPAFVGIEDLSVGADVTLFGRVFHVCGCDAYTRAYYADQGIDQAPDTALPENAIDAQKARASAAAARSNLPTAVQRGMQFLQFDGKVLCFPGILADASAETGARPIILNFYLGDSTGEVKEPGVGLLLHRQRLPVDMPVTGVASVGADPNMQYLRAENLRVGARLRVFAREFTLLDADPFTRAWYKDNLRIDQAPAMPAPAPRPPVPKAPLPPHNGYGSPADSARNCLSLVPKAHNSVRARAALAFRGSRLTHSPFPFPLLTPQDKDYGKYMAFSGMVLRFMSSMEAVAPAVLAESDVGRTFTVNWFLEDGTLSIFEPQRPDRPASRYLERSKVCEPGTEKALTTGAMRVGAELIIHGRKFTLLESDGFTQSFMAQHPELWA
jgi:hypothetical protein